MSFQPERASKNASLRFWAGAFAIVGKAPVQVVVGLKAVKGHRWRLDGRPASFLYSLRFEWIGGARLALQPRWGHRGFSLS